MFKNLSPGPVGIRGLSLAEVIELAAKHGFSGIDFSIAEAADLAKQHGVDYVKELFENARIRPGLWGFPVNWRKDEQTWREGMDALPELAALGNSLGCTRTATWCMPGDNERDYKENWDWTLARFKPLARILADHGCRLGLEFVGPKTLRDSFKYQFIYTLEGMMEFARALGTGNVGLLLDSYHLFTSGGSAADLDKIQNKDIVTVHVNDAVEGVSRDDQIDQERRLPTESGVIDLAAFMRKLSELGYDGPVTIEPFSPRLKAIDDPEQAARLTAEYMNRLWKAGGLD
jgi:sugar phosphate isomerase/epimerase